MRFGIKVGNFVPKTYVQQVVENSDFRKYDDGLRMILDCTPELERALTELLATAAAEQDRALRPAPAGRGDDDLLHAVGDAQRPRPFHRRRPRRLCLGGDGAEGDGGVRGNLVGWAKRSVPTISQQIDALKMAGYAALMPTLRRRDRIRRSPPDARPVLAAAERADAAFDPQRIRARHRDVADIGAAVVGVVDLARPFAGAGRAACR